MKKIIITLFIFQLFFSSSCSNSVYEKRGDELYVKVNEEELYCIQDPDYDGLYICEETKGQNLIEDGGLIDGNALLQIFLRIVTIFI